EWLASNNSRRALAFSLKTPREQQVRSLGIELAGPGVETIQVKYPSRGEDRFVIWDIAHSEFVPLGSRRLLGSSLRFAFPEALTSGVNRAEFHTHLED